MRGTPAVVTRLRPPHGEWFLDLTESKHTRAAYDFAIRQRVLETEGVKEIKKYQSLFDRKSRRLTINIRINAVYGRRNSRGRVMAAKAWIDVYTACTFQLPRGAGIAEGKDFRGIYRAGRIPKIGRAGGRGAPSLPCGYTTAILPAASAYNPYSLALAQGVGVSRVIQTNAMQREQADHSQVALRVPGQAGTVIKNGVATDDAGQRWLLPEPPSRRQASLRSAPGLKN